jgi:hypothetical protein
MIILVGVALFFILELEKRVQRRYGGLIEQSLAKAALPMRGSRRPLQRFAAKLRRYAFGAPR